MFVVEGWGYDQQVPQEKGWKRAPAWKGTQGNRRLPIKIPNPDNRPFPLLRS